MDSYFILNELNMKEGHSKKIWTPFRTPKSIQNYSCVNTPAENVQQNQGNLRLTEICLLLKKREKSPI